MIVTLTCTLTTDLAGQHHVKFEPTSISADHAQVIASALIAIIGNNCNEGWDVAMEAILRDAEKLRKG